MKIAFAADIHRDGRIFPWVEKELQASDVVAIGGDIDDPYLGLPNFKFNYVMHKLRPNVVRDRLLRIAGRSPEKPVVVVLGNHDNRDPRAFHGRSITYEGLVVGGISGSLPGSSPFPFQVKEPEYKSILDQLGHVDVLITHQPPYGTKCDVAYGGAHAGSESIRAYIDKESPRLVLTGHIHESPAVDRVGVTTILNPGPFFEGNYAEVELDGNEVRATIMDAVTGKPKS